MLRTRIRFLALAALMGAVLLTVTPVYAQDGTTAAQGIDPIVGFIAVLGFGALLMIGFVATVHNSPHLKEEDDEEEV